MDERTGRVAAVALLALFTAGCGSVVRGTTEIVTITAEPADAQITTTIGHSCPGSPCAVSVPRRQEFVANATKEGFKPGSVYVGTKLSEGGAAGFAGNVLVGGVVGMGVDTATGAALDHFPNPAHIVLVAADAEGQSTQAVIPPKPPSTQKTPTRSGRGR